MLSIATVETSADTITLPVLQKEPVLIKFVKPRFPASLSRLGITGIITLKLLINEQGTVETVNVLRGLHPDLDSQIVNAAKEFLFSPAIAEGQPVPVIITYEYVVSITDLSRNLVEYINLHGVVLEKGTRRPVPDLQVIISFIDTIADTAIPLPFSLYLQQIGTFAGQEYLDGAILGWTDSSGHFSFKSLPTGPANVKIIAPGYELFHSNLLISAHKGKGVVFRINKLSYDDNEIVIYGRGKDKEISKRTLSSHEISKVAGFNGDAVKVIQALPGVSRASFGLGAIGVRGAPTWDSRFFLDGIPVPQLYHFGGVKSVYNSEALSSVDLYPGGFGVRFGNSIAGIVSLNSRNAQREQINGYADINLMDISVFADGPVNNRTGILASVRRSYLGDLLGFVVKKADALDMPMMIAPYYYDYLVRADLDITPSQKLVLTLFGSKDALELIVPEIDGGSAEVDSMKDRLSKMDAFNMVMAGYDAPLINRLENSFRTALIHGLGDGLLFGIAKWDYKYWEFILRDELSYTVSDRLRITAGFDLWLKKFSQSAIFLKPDRTFYRDTINMTAGIASPFMQTEFTPIPSLIVTSGLRYDYYPELKYRGSLVPEFWNYRFSKEGIGLSGEPSLRLSARYQISKKHTLTAAIGTYNQTPQPLGFTTDPDFGNTGFPASKARQIAFGYNWQINEIISADIQLYHNQQWDLPVIFGLHDLMESADSMFSGGGKGKMYGLELLLRHDQNNRFFGWISYSLSKSKRFSAKENRYIPYENDQTHNLQCVLNYRLPRQWQAGTRIRLVSGNPYTPVVDRVQNMTNRYYTPIYGKENGSRNEPFFQTDLRVEKLLVFDKWLFSVYLDLQNAFWFLYKSPEMTVYNYDYTKKTTLSIPVIPSIGVKAEF